MAAHSEPKIYAFYAGEDLSSKQYCFVKFDSTDTSSKTVLGAGANEKTMGILQNAPASGEIAEVAIVGGGAKLKINEAISAGDLLTPTSGSLGEQVDAADEWCGAIAAHDGVQNDVIAVEVVGYYSSKSDA